MAISTKTFGSHFQSKGEKIIRSNVDTEMSACLVPQYVSEMLHISYLIQCSVSDQVKTVNTD